MNENAINASGWRGSRAGWLEAGYQALIESGVDGVKIMPLAKRLNLSRTSFYWFFDDREALLAALLDGWAARTTLPLIAATRQYAETQAEAMLNVIGCLCRTTPSTRGWSSPSAAGLSEMSPWQRGSRRRMRCVSRP